ncbi:thiamine-phosphate kinase [Maioricimonas rarisocia]|uniref:thiamine-phosphate kinase n=1 Tax=Maioricimonas rarisocia TaxID=2528026 RepID=UPI00119F23E6|nr:thiamine-phosphate kinase [Maioricimonas rarisocia]
MKRHERVSGNELELIEWIRQRTPSHQQMPIGLGDDTALVRCGDGTTLVTTDTLTEGRHFTVPPATPAEIGRKALAVNLSDIAAMAGQPTFAFITLVLPQQRGLSFARELMDGLIATAEEFSVVVAGGDTNVWDGPLVIGVTLMGEPTGSGPVQRSGAVPGDWIMVTGRLGGSLPSGRHLTFTPRVVEAQTLHAACELHAMIDLSDGISTDLGHILDESKIGATIRAAHVPVSPSVPQDLPAEERVQHALNDGEDFELLFTVSPEVGASLLASPPLALPISHIGEITTDSERQLQLPDGRLVPLQAGGWEHCFADPAPE